VCYRGTVTTLQILIVLDELSSLYFFCSSLVSLSFSVWLLFDFWFLTPSGLKSYLAPRVNYLLSNNRTGNLCFPPDSRKTERLRSSKEIAKHYCFAIKYPKASVATLENKKTGNFLRINGDHLLLPRAERFLGSLLICMFASVVWYFNGMTIL